MTPMINAIAFAPAQIPRATMTTSFQRGPLDRKPWKRDPEEEGCGDDERETGEAQHSNAVAQEPPARVDGRFDPFLEGPKPLAVGRAVTLDPVSERASLSPSCEHRVDDLGDGLIDVGQRHG